MHSYNDCAGSLRLHVCTFWESESPCALKQDELFLFFPSLNLCARLFGLKRTIPYDYRPLSLAALYVQDTNPLVWMEIIFLSMQYLALRSSGNETSALGLRPQITGRSSIGINTLNIGVNLTNFALLKLPPLHGLSMTFNEQKS